MLPAEGLTYREFAPAAGLAEIVARYWCMQAPDNLSPGSLHTVLPDGCVDLVVVGRGSGFFTVRGPRKTPLGLPLQPDDRFWGARLWPDMGGHVLGVAAKSLLEIQTPVASFFGADADDLAHGVMSEQDSWRQQFDAWFTDHATPKQPVDTKVRLALLAQNATAGGMSTSMLADLVGLSARQLQRRFSAATGLTLKTYARIRRLRNVVGHLLDGETTSWAGVAASLGFADQSHLIAEFRRLAGARPAEVAQYISNVTHSDVIP